MARSGLLIALLVPIISYAQSHAGDPRVDAHGDPLPAGAIARLGSNRFRTASWVRNLAFSHDDRALVACLNEAVVVWDRATGKELRQFAIPHSSATALSPDGKHLALLDEKKIRIWDTANGKKTRTLQGPGTAPSYVAIVFSHDGKTLAVAEDEQVILYDWAAANKPVTLKDVKKVTGLAFSPDGRWLAIAPYNDAPQLWDPVAGKRIRDAKMKEKPFPRSICFSPDSKKIAWIDIAWRVQTADVASGELGAEFECLGDGVCLFSADGKHVISGSQGVGVELWDLATKKKKCDIATDGHRHPVFALSHDGKTLAIGDSRGDFETIRLYDFAADREIPDEPGHLLSINALAFSADCKTLASADHGRFLFWDAHTGERRRVLSVGDTYSPVVSPRRPRTALRGLLRPGPFARFEAGGPCLEFGNSLRRTGCGQRVPRISRREILREGDSSVGGIHARPEAPHHDPQ